MIPEPEWLEDDVLHLLHDEQVELFGGLLGVRDEDAILSTLAKPRFLYRYDEDADMADLAAAYLYGFARPQGFLDGNKRTAVVACFAFLDVNGYPLDVPHRHLYWITMAAAKGTLSREAVAEWLRRYIQQEHRRTLVDRATRSAIAQWDRMLDRLIRWSERPPPEPQRPRER